jgi:hypothetical protein
MEKSVLTPEPFDLPEDADFRVWRDSGVLRTMAEQGIRFDGIFSAWGRLDADEAVREWITWPNLSDQEDADGKLIDIVTGGEDWSEKTVARLAGILKNADWAVHERIIDWMQRYPGKGMLKDQEPAFRNLLEKEGGP